MRRALTTALFALAATLGLMTAPAQADFAPYAVLAAGDQRVHAGCHPYRYHYRITVPTNVWAAEAFLVGPDGRRLGSDYFLSNADPAAGRASFEMCRRAMKAGKYTIRMRVTYIDGYDEVIGWVKPTRFRITRR